MNNFGLRAFISSPVLIGSIAFLPQRIPSFKMDYLWLAFAVLFALAGLLLLLKKVHYSLNLIFLLTPLSVDLALAGETKLSAPAELLTLLAFGLIFMKLASGLKFRSQLLLHPLSLLLFLFVVSLFCSAMGSADRLIAIKKLISIGVFITVFYFFVAQNFLKTKDLKKIYLLYGLGLLIPIMSSTYKHAVWDFRQEASVYVSLPFYDEHTVYGACIAFIVPFFVLKISSKHLKFDYRILYVLSSIIIFIGLVLSYSRAAWLSLIAALMFYLFIKIKGKFGHLVLILGLVSGVIFINFNSIYTKLQENTLKYGQDVGTHLASVSNLKNDASNKERINRWVCAVRMFEEKPVFGFGPGTYQFNYGKFQTKAFTTRISTHLGNKGNAHSEYLTYLSETGLIGFSIFLLIVFYSIYLSIRLLRSDLDKETRLLVLAAALGLVSFYVHGLFNTFSDSPKMALLFYSSLALLVSVDLRSIEDH
ncbi:MAG: O-antigen ligase family protein [Flavobacteriales bacterium]